MENETETPMPPAPSTASTAPDRSVPAPRPRHVRSRVRPKDIHRFLETVLGDDFHAHRVVSVANGVNGVVHAAVLSIHAIGMALLTLLGAAGERADLDRMLRANTVKRRTHSLFRQGCYWYGAIPAMPDERLKLLMDAYAAVVAEHAVFAELFGVL